MDRNSPDIELEKPSVIINEGATIVKEFIADFVSEGGSEESSLVLSEEGKLRLQSQYNIFTQKHNSKEFDKTVVRKYYYFCDEMHRVYKKATRAVIACKIITAIMFLILTAVLIYAGNRFGDKMLWFSIWVLLIFIDVAVFIVVDYFSDSIKNKALPYLDDIETLSFRQNIKDEDTETEDDEDDEDFEVTSEKENEDEDDT